MSTPTLIWGAPEWAAVTAGLLALAAALLLWNYLGAGASRPVRLACATLKAVGFSALALALLEPLLTGTRPRRGANAFAVVVDNSQSLRVRDDASPRTRGDWVRDRLHADAPWRTRLAQDFDSRAYVFDAHLRSVETFDGLAFDGEGTALAGSLATLARRFRGLPLAGVLLFTDGNRTDAGAGGDPDWSGLPPVYPVIPPSTGSVRDVGVGNVSVSQTNFESAPVVIRADVLAAGYRGDPVVATVVDEAGKELARQEATPAGDSSPLSFRFQFRPEKKGLSFYRVQAFPASEIPKPGADATTEPPVSREQTLANNSRLVMSDQGGGPYRVLYVSGRPNWEFKFLRRAEDEDEQVQLVGLLRIARRQPKFDFQNAGSRSTSPLFQGFDHPDAEVAERADQPVLVRFGVDEAELRDGFPKTADALYRYHAVILDDLEAGFFTQDQLTLLRNFVSVRGGGLLMLGGPDAFADGRYDRTPVGEMLPVYLNRGGPLVEAANADEDAAYRLLLTREGTLQPWVRLRKTEDEERQRLAGMPAFRTLSRAGAVKPGATVLSQVTDPSGRFLPALVAQSFGKGHVAAWLVGDLWRWGMKREDPQSSDLERSWRQTVRWLVGDVPERVDVNIRPKDKEKDGTASSSAALEVLVRVRDAEYRPLDNAKVAVRVALPGGDTLTLDAAPEGREAGTYAATYVPRKPGAHRFLAVATAPDGSAAGEREAGWAVQPAADEFARLSPDRAFLERLASKTNGEVVDGARLEAFVAGLAARDAPVTEPWSEPLWHNPWYFLVAITCLTAEWGLRRVNGLA